MAKSTQAAKLAEINSATSQPVNSPSGGRTPKDRRTVAPTPEAERDDAGETDSLVNTARDAAAQKAEAVKNAAAETAHEHGEQLKDAADQFDPHSYAQAATERLADTLDQTARSIQNADLGALTDDVATFARRQPLLFFGGAALLGFAAGRMLKASERAEHDHASPYTAGRS